MLHFAFCTTPTVGIYDTKGIHMPTSRSQFNLWVHFGLR